MNTRLQRSAREQRGAVLVFFALFAPVAVLFLSFVIDVGNWFDHARHLQTQADAGALAAAQGFQPCNDTAIYSAAGQYSGASSVTTPTGGSAAAGSPLYNLQLGGTPQSNIHELINSPTYYNQSSPVDSTVNATNPCTAEMVDVKLTETNLPWYLRLLSLGAPRANVHARVEILERTTATGSLPVAVNDLRPKAVEAYFVDESVSPAKQLATCGSGMSLCSVELKSDGTSNGLSVWDNVAAPYGFAVKKPNVGVRIAVSGRSSLTGNMSTDCAMTFVTCSDASSAAVGLLHVQGYSGNGAATTSVPIARKVQLSGAPAGCSDGYFANPVASCALAVSTEVDYGTTTRPAGADVDALVGGSCYALTYQSTSGTNELWGSAEKAPTKTCSNFKGKGIAGTGYIPLAHEAGATQIDLQAFDSSMKEPKKFTAVQRSYAASTNSEPAQEAFLGREGGLIRGEDSFRMCESGNEGEKCTPKLVVRLGLKGSLGDAQSVGDPVYTMRFTGTGSQNQSVKCKAVNGGESFAATLASGCAGEWAINPTLTCPDKPSDCVVPATGNKENQVPRGMNLRILGSEKPETCTSPNHWKEFTFTNGVPNVSASDPRVVTAFVTPYGSFGTNGASSEFPIAEFATFYVTGWQDKGEGFSNPCQGKGDDPAEAGTIVGHFIKYVETLAPAGSGGSTCEVNSLNECIAVLTN
jgi:Flp pilus assembly protein TadG